MCYTDKKIQTLSTMVPITYLNSMTLGHLEVHDLKFGQACLSTLYKLSMAKVTTMTAVAQHFPAFLCMKPRIFSGLYMSFSLDVPGHILKKCHESEAEQDRFERYIAEVVIK